METGDKKGTGCRFYRRTSAIERFFVLAGEPTTRDGCWLWKGAKNKKGYGWFLISRLMLRRISAAHRVSYLLFNGDIGDGLSVLHRCDTPSCVNPDHLFLGTAMDNVRDCIKKDRFPRGEKTGTAKLTAESVAAIRSLSAAGGCTMKALAFRFGVSDQSISDIIHGRSWKHEKTTNTEAAS